MNKFGLPERTVNELLEYFKSKPGVEKVVVYGSRAKGNFRNGSDIDFAIWTDDKSAYELRIEAELDDLETPYMFDVTDYKNLSHEGMKNSIDRDGVLFYQKENWGFNIFNISPYSIFKPFAILKTVSNHGSTLLFSMFNKVFGKISHNAANSLKVLCPLSFLIFLPTKIFFIMN